MTQLMFFLKNLRKYQSHWIKLITLLRKLKKIYIIMNAYPTMVKVGYAFLHSKYHNNYY